MVAFRTSMRVLAVLHGLFILFTATVTAFSYGGVAALPYGVAATYSIGGVAERLLLFGLHPPGALGLLVLMFVPRLAATDLRIIVLLLVLNVVADLVLAAFIAQGSVKGEWWLALVFGVVPAIGIVYVVTQSLYSRHTERRDLWEVADGPHRR